MVCVEGNLISNVLELETNSKIPELPGVSIEDLGNAYLIPGLIDSNIKYSPGNSDPNHFLESAISGGVTTICLEKSPNTNISTESPQCHVETIPVIQSCKDLESITGEPIAFKVYFCLQNNGVQPIDDFESLCFEASKLKIPVIVDASCPQPRFLYMASPYRGIDIYNRLEAKRVAELRNSTFTMAIDLPEESSDSEDEDTHKRRRPTHTSKSQEYEFQQLSQQELDTYKDAGETTYTNLTPGMDSSSSTLLNRRKRSATIAPISVKKEEKPPEECYSSYLFNVPARWEIEGVESVLQTIARLPCKVHFANIATSDSIKRIKIFKKQLPITCETCPHYVYFSSKDIPKRDTRFKTFPPIRTEENRRQLSQQVLEEDIDMVSSNHCYYDSELKLPGEFRRAIPGVQVLGCSLQALWTKIRPQNHEKFVVKLVNMMSTKPAEVLGLSDRGSIQAGKKADLVVWHPEKLFVPGRNPACIYNKQMLNGKISKVIVEGKVVKS